MPRKATHSQPWVRTASLILTCTGDRELALLMKRYVPEAVVPRIEQGATDEGQIAEVRDVSVLFINCIGVDLAADADGDCRVATAQGTKLMQEIQKLVTKWEGQVTSTRSPTVARSSWSLELVTDGST